MPGGDPFRQQGLSEVERAFLGLPGEGSVEECGASRFAVSAGTTGLLILCDEVERAEEVVDVADGRRVEPNAQSGGGGNDALKSGFESLERAVVRLSVERKDTETASDQLGVCVSAAVDEGTVLGPEALDVLLDARDESVQGLGFGGEGENGADDLLAHGGHAENPEGRVGR